MRKGQKASKATRKRMSESGKVRSDIEIVRQRAIERNKTNNPNNMPHVRRKRSEQFKKNWADPKWRAKMLEKRKKNHYTPPTFGYSWKGKTKTEEQKIKYREFSKAKEELAKLSEELGLGIDTRRINKEAIIKTLNAIKKLP